VSTRETQIIAVVSRPFKGPPGNFLPDPGGQVLLADARWLLQRLDKLLSAKFYANFNRRQEAWRRVRARRRSWSQAVLMALACTSGRSVAKLPVPGGAEGDPAAEEGKGESFKCLNAKGHKVRSIKVIEVFKQDPANSDAEG